VSRLDLRGVFAPDGRPIAVCPHCWEVNRRVERLCGRCGADMNLLLQESGGLRATAAIQSPVPVRVGSRLSALQRLLVLLFVLILFAGQVLSAIFAGALDWIPAGHDVSPVVPASAASTPD
jgi:hypothetical protein